MAALIGDLYGMSNQARGDIKTPRIRSLMDYAEPMDDDEQAQDALFSSDPKQTQISRQQDTADDHSSDSIISDDGHLSSNDETLGQTLDRAMAFFKLWRGEDFEFNEDEAKTIKALVANSDDPIDALSRYAAASGLSQLYPELDATTAYFNLDSISEYYTGKSYEANDVGLFQKVKNGFTLVDISRKQDRWRELDLAGKTEEAEKLENEILQELKDLGDVSSAIPTSKLDEITTSVLGNLGYMSYSALKGAAAGAAVKGLGTLAVGLVNPIAGIGAATVLGTVSAATSAFVAADEMRSQTRGSTYWDMMHDNAGVPQKKDIANALSEVNGAFVGLTETFVDGVFSRGLNIGIGKITGKTLPKFGSDMLFNLDAGGASRRLAQAGMDWVTEALDEGFLNELPQTITDELVTAAYKASINLPVDISMGEILGDGLEAAKMGIINGLVYGGLHVPASFAGYTDIAVNLRRAANKSKDWVEYVDNTRDIKKPDNVPSEDFEKAKRNIYEAKEQTQAEVFGGTVLESNETIADELYSTVDSMGVETAKALPSGEVYRNDDNSLFHAVETNSDSSYTISFGNGDTKAVYGAVTLDTDGNNIDIKSVRVRRGYEGIREEMVLDAIDAIQSTETEVKWEPKTAGLIKVKENLIASNPKGKQAGLNYEFRAKTADEDIKSLANEIRSYSPNLTQQEATLAARLYSIADRGDILTSVNKGMRFESTDTLMKAQLRGRNEADIRGATSKAKALIYAGQNSDISTFNHELFHVVTGQRRNESRELSKAIADTFSNEVSKEHLRSFIDDHKAIWGNSADIDSIMDSLSSINADDYSWNGDVEENLARLYEAYRSSTNSQRKSLPDGIRAILRKLAEFMNKVYRTLRDGVALNEDIAKAYDRLMGFDSSEDLTSNTIAMQNSNDESDIISQGNEDEAVYAKNNADAIRYLKGKQGKDIVNKHDGTVVRFGSNGRNKMISNKARGKSLANGFTAWEHNTAASNVDILFENSLKISEELDRDNNANVRIMRYETPIRFIPGSKTGYAEMLVKKSLMPKGNSNTLYTIELTGIRKEPNLIDGKLSEEEYRASSSIVNLPSESADVNVDILYQTTNYDEYQAVEAKYKGTDQWMKAPNGKPTNLTERQWVQVRTPSFIKWFGDWINNPDNASKVVDENGEPLVMYHGTRASFDVFDTSYEGEDRKEYESAWMADYPDGTMFAISDRKEASYYGSNVMPLFLNIREKEMKASSFAEAIDLMDNGDASFSDTVIKVYKDNDWRDDPREFEGAIVAFHNSNDAKSATDNIGTFDSNNDNILFQTAYHGSPYGFDEFSTDKVNSGEGSQHYGWGIYLTSSQSIATDYAERLGRDKESVEEDIEFYSKRLDESRKEKKEKIAELERRKTEEYWDNNEQYQAMLRGVAKIPAFKKRMYNDTYGAGNWTQQSIAAKWKQDAFNDTPEKNTGIKVVDGRIEEYERLISDLQKAHADGHHVYTVDIPNRTYIYWDKPVSDSMMDKIWKNLKTKGIIDNETEEWEQSDFYAEGVKGENLYIYLEKLFNSDKKASMFLDSIGIKGINYPTDSQSGKKSRDRNYVIFNAKNIIIEDHIRFQDKYEDSGFDMLDSIETEEDASDAIERLSVSDEEIKAAFPDYNSFDSELSDDWDPNIYYGEEVEDPIDYENMLSNESKKTDVEKTSSSIESIENSTESDEIVVNAQQMDMEWRDFAEANKPDIAYDGTEEEKDRTFVEAIKNPKTMRQYLGIIGEAIMLDTPTLNAYYEEEYNKTYHRYQRIRQVYPFTDEEYRVGLQNRVLRQVTNADVRKAAKYAVENAPYPKTTGLERKAFKELSKNARFYRNVLAPLVNDKGMLPSTLIESKRSLDLPSREKLDLLSVSELADIARRINRDDLVEKIQNGTLKFGGDIDDKEAKAIQEAIRYQNDKIAETEKDMKNLQDSKESLENSLSEISKKLEQRDGIISSAYSILDTFRNSIIGDKDNGIKNKLGSRYAELWGVLNNLNDEESYQRNATAKGSRSKGKALGAKLGTANYMRDMKALYPDLFVSSVDDRELYWTEGKSTKDNEEIRHNIEARKASTESEMKDVRAKMLDATVRNLMLNGNDVNKALNQIKGSIEGLAPVIDKRELGIYKARITKLIDKNQRTYEKVKALNKAIRSKSKENQHLLKAIDDLRARLGEESKENTEHRNEIKRLESRLGTATKRIDEMRIKYSDSIKALKNDVRAKKQKEREYRRIRHQKESIAKAIMRPVNLNSIDYDTSAEAIMAIQALIDPTFRREWVYDIKEDPQQDPGYSTMTVDEAKDYFNHLDDAQRLDLMQYMSPELIDRLTEQKRPLNDWTIDELEQLAKQVTDLRQKGKEVLVAKKEAEKQMRYSIQRSIINALSEKGRTKDSLPGSANRLAEGRAFKSKLEKGLYSTFRMQELAQLIDGGFGKKGYAYKLLVDEKRYHQGREQMAIEKRTDTVKPYLTEKNLDEMAQTVAVDLGGKIADFTIDQLAYVFLSQYDESNRNAVAYGALLSEEEKGTNIGKTVDFRSGQILNEYLMDSINLIRDDNELEAIGEARYKKLLAVAKRELEDRGLMDLVEAIGADFNNPENTRRLNRASIDTFNRPLDARDYYLSIHRTDRSGDNFEDDIANSLFNLNTNQVQMTPEKGFLVPRVEISPRKQRNIDLSLLNNWDRAVADQEHLIEFAGYVRQLRSIFESNGEVIRSIDKAYSKALANEITQYINLIANPHLMERSNNSLASILRGRTGAAYLGWKISGILLQAITSPMPGLSEIDPAHLAGAYFQIARHPIESIDMINEKSSFMKNRTMNQIIDESLKRQNQWNAKWYTKALNKQEEIGQIGLTLVDRYAVAGNWLAMYQKGLKENLDQGMDTNLAEAAAVKRADDFIHRTQPEGDITELASMFRSKNEIVKAVLQFQTSLNVIWNNLVPNIIGFKRNKEFSKIVGTIFGYAAAGVILGLVADGFSGDDDIKKKLLKVAYWSVSQEASSIPYIGNSIEGISQKLITGERDFPSNGVIVYPGVDKMLQALTSYSNRDWWKGTGKALEAVGLFSGLPVSGIKQAFRALTGEPEALLGR